MKTLPKVPKPKVSLISKIDSYLRKIANPYYDNSKSKPRVRPSDLGCPCMRKILYSYLRIDPDHKITADQKKIFDTGDAFHDMIKEWVKGAGLLIEYKDPKTGELPISKYTGKPDSEFPISVEELEIKSGKIDGILILDGKLWIGEFKSSKEEKFEDLIDATDEHKIQANIYAHIFEFCWERGDYDHIKELEPFSEIAGVIFLYCNKNNTDLKEYVVLKEDSSLEAIVAKYSELKGFVERKELPPKTEHYCFFCPFSTKCKKEFNPLKDPQ